MKLKEKVRKKIVKWLIVTENKVKSQGGGGVMRAGALMPSNTVVVYSIAHVQAFSKDFSKQLSSITWCNLPICRHDL